MQQASAAPDRLRAGIAEPLRLALEKAQRVGGERRGRLVDAYSVSFGAHK